MMKKRVFSILLTAALLVGMIPASVLAETEKKTAEEPRLEAEEQTSEAEESAQETDEPDPEAEEPVPAADESVPEAEKPDVPGNAGIRPLSDHEPMKDKFVTITWTGPVDGPQVTYTQGATTDPTGDQKDSETIRAITDGLWWVRIAVVSAVEDQVGEDVLTDGLHDYQMILPEGDVALIFGKQSGKDEYGNIDWTLDENGTIRFDVHQILTEGTWDYDESFAVRVTDASGQIPGGMPEEPLDPAITKTGTFDAAAHRIFWTVTALIPAYNGGTFHVWGIKDEEGYFDDSGTLGDLEMLSVSVESGGYNGEIHPVAEAGDDDRIAYQLTTASDSHQSIDTQTLYLVNRCQCVSGNCADWQDGRCGTVQKDGWCTCWNQYYNTKLTILCSADATEILQGLEEDSDDMSVTIRNQATIQKDGASGKSDSAKVDLKKLLTKLENTAPHYNNTYTGSYTITVNPNRYDYSRQDAITITDTMQGLIGQVSADHPFSVVTGQGDALTEIPEEEAKAKGRDGHEDQYFSLSEEKLTDPAGEVCGDLLTIKIWYPTDQTYVLSYEAQGITPETADAGSGVIAYRNTAAEGDIFVDVAGSFTMGDEHEHQEEKRLVLTKVDAGDPAVRLEGAVFDAYLYRAGKDDYYLNSLTTDADGVGVLISQGSEVTDRPYMLANDRLYYVEERSAPAGYQLNPTRYWFYWRDEGLSPEELPEEAVEGVNLFIKDLEAEADRTLAFTVEDLPEEEEEIPQITKEIFEDDYERKEADGTDLHDGENLTGDGWGSWDDADNRQEIQYRLRLTGIRNAVGLTLHDHLEEGLTFKPKTVAVLLIDAGRAMLQAGTDYTVTRGACSDPACPMDGCTFEVHLQDPVLAGLSEEAYLVVTYRALTDTAPDDYDDYRDEILNHAYLTCGAEPEAYCRSEVITTETDLFGFGFLKYAEDEEGPFALAGAKFVLSRSGITGDGSPGTLFAMFERGTDTEDSSYWMVSGWTDRVDEAGELVSAADGMIRILGLDDDRYCLQETAAPAGYERLTESILVTIGEDGSVTVDSSDAVSREESPGEESRALEFRVRNLPSGQPKQPETVSQHGDEITGVKTGDGGHIGLWLVLLAAGLACLLAGIRRRRKNF